MGKRVIYATTLMKGWQHLEIIQQQKAIQFAEHQVSRLRLVK